MKLICRVLSPDDTNAFYRKLKLGFNISTALINGKDKSILLCRGRMPTDNQMIDSNNFPTDLFDSSMFPGTLDKFGCSKNDFFLSANANFSALFADTSNIPEDNPEI